jgi:formylglycine-generating enzyme required for sulfatase activity
MERYALLLAVGLVAGCSALTDFSEDKDDATTPPADDSGTRDDGGGAEAGLYCHSGGNPCPSGSVLLPCGPVLMGSDLGEGDSDEEPEHVVNVSAFCMDETEVTNRDYFDCVATSGCSPPYGSNSRTRAAYYGNATYDGFPVLNVDWAQAAAYCGFRGKRLPTEAEWEKAARGGCEVVAPSGCGSEDERTYPWGEADPDCTYANFVACVGDTEAVGAHPAGASPYGVQDMAGNVQEWVADWYAGTYYDLCRTDECIDPTGPPTGSERTFRGGAWDSAAPYVRVANRFRQVDGYANDNLGFRCAADLR